MPKVISGTLKGRNINGFRIDGTRPTMDRVKESVFGMIQNYLYEALVLDLFSGSGNLGIESLSNGARLVYFNDYNNKYINTIKDNLNNFGISNKGILLNYDYRKCLDYLSKELIKLDLVFLDPPYKDLIINEILDLLLKKELLNNNGLVICEMDKKEYYNSDKLVLFKEKKYENKYVLFYQKVK